jgi:hypothetical protein
MNNLSGVAKSSTSTTIDFKKLLQQERQKARKEQRLCRRLGHQKEKGGEAQDNNNSEKGKAQKNGIPKIAPLPVWNNHAHLKLYQTDDIGNNPLLLDRLDIKRHVVCSNNPSSIYYISNFISVDYQKALTEWLLQLPENSSSTLTSDKQLSSMQQQEENAMSCWTTLTYAQRRVALFDNRPPPPPSLTATDAATFEESGRHGFPEPLASLAQHISNFMMEIMPRPVMSNTGNNNDPNEFESTTTHNKTITGINHILINDYCYVSHQGILPHTDGPAYYPLTATLSLESCAILHFSPRLLNDEKEEKEETTTIKKIRKNVSVLLEPRSLVIFHDEAYSDYLHSIQGKGNNITATANDENVHNDNDDDNVEIVSETCVNAPTGMIVKRGPQRISLTFRVKK